MISCFSLAGFIGLISIPYLRQLSGIMELVVYALILGCVGGISATIILFFHRQLEKIPFVAWWLRLWDGWTNGMITHLTEAMDDFRSAWKTLIAGYLIGVVGIHLNLAIVVICLGQGFALKGIAIRSYILATVLGNVAGIIPITPAGAGTRDAVIKQLLSAGGVPEGTALAIALLTTGIVLIFNFVGGIFFIFDRKKKNSNHEEHDVEEETS